ncbi:MAG TPA: trypsin-like peptidase domain-containing protein, partial [Burkholderiales bacterium]
MRKLWLVFSQAATVALAVLFVVSTLRPDLLPWQGRGGTVVTVREAAGEGGPRATLSYGDAARKAMPAVVNVFTSKEVKMSGHPMMNDPLFKFFFGDRFDGETQRASSLGSGVIASPEGYVLTNHHVVEAADEIEVALADGRTARAAIVGSDPESDLAVVRIDLKNLPAITFGRSEQAKVGDVVLAIGNPLGVGQTVTMGIVSAIGRSGLGINTFENFIQTDAAINQGNSGGALVDAGGNLIGINTAILSRSGGNIGIGFAIPATLARQVMEQIIQTGSVTRGWIGVEVQDLTNDLAESFKVSSGKGVLIAGVIPGSPAEKGGIRRGDVLVAVEGKPVADA